jgi:hypothetical protein
VLLPDSSVLIAGRYDGVACQITLGPPATGACPGTAELYDPVTGTFSPPTVAQSMEGHAATLLPDGPVLLTGGFQCCGLTIATAEIYHPAVLVPSPVLYSLAGGAQGAILHAATQQVVSSNNPAVPGEVSGRQVLLTCRANFENCPRRRKSVSNFLYPLFNGVNFR